MNRQVPAEEGMKYAREVKSTFIEVSAKSGENVTAMFTDIATAMTAPEATPQPEHPSGGKHYSREVDSEPAEPRHDRPGGFRTAGPATDWVLLILAH